MSNEIKVGSRVKKAYGVEGRVKSLDTIGSGSLGAAVKFDNGEFYVIRLEALILIPDTVTIELSRETVEIYGGQWLGDDQHFEELVQACRKALGMEEL